MDQITLDQSHLPEMIAAGFSPSIAKRLARRLRVTDNGCIEWIGSTLHFGHGHMSRGARGAGFEPTHRVAWMLANGPIPEGINVCHTCDNPPCCNPAHLFLGTQQDNIRDMWSKGRQNGQLPKGERHPSARLTDIQVAEIRRIAPEVGNHAALGRMFGISKQHARALVLGNKR